MLTNAIVPISTFDTIVNLVATFLIFGLLLLLARYYWSWSALRMVRSWCEGHGYVPLDTPKPDFVMARPASVVMNIKNADGVFRATFTLRSGILSLPSSLLDAWGEVVLESLEPLEP
jgi:hypothetical protein